MPPLVEQEASKLSSSGVTPSLLSQFRSIILDSKTKPLPTDTKPSLPPGFELEQVAQFKSKFTGTYKFKYRLKYEEIPLYGSSIIVELDDNGKSLFSDSAFVDQDETLKKEFPLSDPTIRPEELPSYINKYYSQQGQYISLEYYDLNPKLYYYFDSYKNGSTHKIGNWRLVYVTDIKQGLEKIAKHDTMKHFRQSPEILSHKMIRKEAVIEKAVSPELFDYIVDAHEKEVVAKLSNVRTFC